MLDARFSSPDTVPLPCCKGQFFNPLATRQAPNAIQYHVAVKGEFLPQGGVDHGDQQAAFADDLRREGAGSVLRPHDVLPVLHDDLFRPRGD